MKFRWVMLFLAVFALTAVVHSVLKGSAPPKSEPVFAGKNVRQWLMGDQFGTNQAAVKLAVVALGKKAVPGLRTMLRSGAKWQRIYFAHSPLWLYRKLPFGGDQFDRKDRAMWALAILADDGRDATPELLAIARDPTEHWNQRQRALSTLRAIRADHAIVLPVLDKLTNDAVIAKVAADHARSLRREAQHRREHSWHAIARTNSSVAASAKPEFRPSTSFLGNSSMWDDEPTRRRLLPLSTNTTLLQRQAPANAAGNR